MTAPWDLETVNVPGLAQLEQRLHIGATCSIAVLNAPADSALRLLAVSRADPYQTDVVIAFATRRRHLAWLKPAYRAAWLGRTGWIVYAEPGQPGSDLSWEWFLAALRQYGVQALRQQPIDENWSAVLLAPMRRGDSGAVPAGGPTY